MSLDVLTKTLKQFLLSYKQKNPTFDLDTNQPLWAWKEYAGADTGDSPKLVYHPQSFEKRGHSGKTKAQILKEQETPGQAQGDDDRTSDNGWKGWTVHLLQPSNLDTQVTETPTGFANIPRKDQGTPQGDLTPRSPLEAGQSPIEYLSIPQSSQDNHNSPYSHESGMTPEDWIMAFMTHLSETGKPLDNYANGTESISYLIGAFFPSFVNVPFAYWYRDDRRARLIGDDPCFQDGSVGARFSVII